MISWLVSSRLLWPYVRGCCGRVFLRACCSGALLGGAVAVCPRLLWPRVSLRLLRRCAASRLMRAIRSQPPYASGCLQRVGCIVGDDRPARKVAVTSKTSSVMLLLMPFLVHLKFVAGVVLFACFAVVVWLVSVVFGVIANSWRCVHKSQLPALAAAAAAAAASGCNFMLPLLLTLPCNVVLMQWYPVS